MFECYTESARRTLVFAPYEASQFGSTTIEPEHLLLGLLRDRQVSEAFWTAAGLIETLRREAGAVLIG